MATVDECRQAVSDLAARLDKNAEAQGKLELDRTIAVRVTDLSTAFHGRLAGGRLLDITDGDDPKAKIALSVTGDDLVALVAGKLNMMQAVTSGRASIKANPFDLLKLRKLL